MGRGGPGEPAQNTIFGWVLSDDTTSPSFTPTPAVHAHHVQAHSELDLALRRFWEAEEIPLCQPRRRRKMYSARTTSVRLTFAYLMGDTQFVFRLSILLRFQSDRLACSQIVFSVRLKENLRGTPMNSHNTLHSCGNMNPMFICVKPRLSMKKKFRQSIYLIIQLNKTSTLAVSDISKELNIDYKIVLNHLEKILEISNWISKKKTRCLDINIISQ